MNWSNISLQRGLSENFIEEHANDLHWHYICFVQKLSEDFIEKMEEYIDWGQISHFQTLSEPFIKKHFEKLNFYSLIKNQTLSEDFVMEHFHKANFWDWFSENKHVTEELLERFFYNWDWAKVSKNIPLSAVFIRKHNEKIHMDKVVEGQNHTLSFLQEFEGEFNPYYLSFNPHLTDDILEYFKEDLAWNILVRYNALSFETIQTYIAYIDLDDVHESRCISLTKKQWKIVSDLKESIS